MFDENTLETCYSNLIIETADGTAQPVTHTGTLQLEGRSSAPARVHGERGHGATLRARGSVSSGTPPEQDVTLVLPLREQVPEREREQVPVGTTLIHSTG